MAAMVAVARRGSTSFVLAWRLGRSTLTHSSPTAERPGRRNGEKRSDIANTVDADDQSVLTAGIQWRTHSDTVRRV